MLVLLTLVLVAGAHSAGHAETVTITADRDATMIEDPDGAWANGAGPLFVDRTSEIENSRRRALLRFDLEGALPRRAIVESVELTVRVEPSNSGGLVMLHRLLQDWSEGPTISGGGGGRPSQPGDVTWIHTEFPLDRWVRPGGLFVARASASTWIGDPGVYSWTDRRHMVRDVRLWQHAPSRNFGWILIGEEAVPQSAKRIASREDPDPAKHPRLTITYRLPGR